MERVRKVPIKTLQRRCENLWKKFCHLRDGKVCQVRLHYPQLQLSHNNILQVDHCFSRSDKNLFIEPANGTVVCSACNMNKKHQNKSVHRLIDNIVAKREGLEKFEEMKSINMSHRPNVLWHSRDWLEQQEAYLKQLIESLSLTNDSIMIDLSLTNDKAMVAQ